MDPMKSTKIWISRFVNPARLGCNLPNLNEGKLGGVFRSISGLRGCDGRDMLAKLYRNTDWLRGELIDLGAALAIRDEVFCEAQSSAAWTIIRAAKLTYADYIGQSGVPVSESAHGESKEEVAADPVAVVEAAEATAPAVEPDDLPPAAKKVHGKRAKGIEVPLADLVAMEMAVG